MNLKKGWLAIAFCFLAAICVAQESYPNHQVNINFGYGTSMPLVSDAGLKFSSTNPHYVGYSWNIQIGDDSPFYVHLSDLVFSMVGMTYNQSYPADGGIRMEKQRFRSYCFGGFGLAYYVLPEFYFAASIRPYMIRNSEIADAFGETLAFISAEVSYKVAERFAVFGRFQDGLTAPTIDYVTETGKVESSSVKMRLAHVGIALTF